MSESGFMKVYKDKLNRRLKELKDELQDINSKLDDETKSPYDLYIMKLELDGAIEALEKETIESKRYTERNLNDKFYMRKFEIEGALKTLEKEKKELQEWFR